MSERLKLNIGTRSLLFGVHQLFIHPIFIALAWWKLYGFPFDPRLWVAFMVHDWGYWGKPNMNGPEGDQHPIIGAWIMGRLFGSRWYDFCMYHSRFLAKKNRQPYSRLCVADKLVISMTPYWIYLPLANLSGEIHEYMSGEGAQTPALGRNQKQWLLDLQRYVSDWAYEHKNLKEDTWTGTDRDHAITKPSQTFLEKRFLNKQ